MIHVLAHQVRRVRAWSGTELLHAAAADGGEIQILFLVHADAVHAPERAGERAQTAPRVDRAAVQVGENCIVVIDRNGNIIETWKQWDKMLRRPHSVYVSPAFSPQKARQLFEETGQDGFGRWPRHLM